MTKDEALVLALTALHTEGEHHPRVYEAMDAIQTVLAQLPLPVRPWVGLTAEEIASIPLNEHALQTAEKLLKEKNHG